MDEDRFPVPIQVLRSLCRIFDLDPGTAHVQHITIHAGVRELPRVYIETVGTQERIGRIAQVLGEARPEAIVWEKTKNETGQWVTVEQAIDDVQAEEGQDQRQKRRQARRQEVMTFLHAQKLAAIGGQDWKRAAFYRDAVDLLRALEEQSL